MAGHESENLDPEQRLGGPDEDNPGADIGAAEDNTRIFRKVSQLLKPANTPTIPQGPGPAAVEHGAHGAGAPVPEAGWPADQEPALKYRSGGGPGATANASPTTREYQPYVADEISFTGSDGFRELDDDSPHKSRMGLVGTCVLLGALAGVGSFYLATRGGTESHANQASEKHSAATSPAATHKPTVAPSATPSEQGSSTPSPSPSPSASPTSAGLEIGHNMQSEDGGQKFTLKFDGKTWLAFSATGNANRLEVIPPDSALKHGFAYVLQLQPAVDNDGQIEIVKKGTKTPYEVAQGLFGDLTGKFFVTDDTGKTAQAIQAYFAPAS